MTGNLVTLRFNDQASADQWFTTWCENHDAPLVAKSKKGAA